MCLKDSHGPFSSALGLSGGMDYAVREARHSVGGNKRRKVESDAVWTVEPLCPSVGFGPVDWKVIGGDLACGGAGRDGGGNAIKAFKPGEVRKKERALPIGASSKAGFRTRSATERSSAGAR